MCALAARLNAIPKLNDREEMAERTVELGFASVGIHTRPFVRHDWARPFEDEFEREHEGVRLRRCRREGASMTVAMRWDAA